MRRRVSPWALWLLSPVFRYSYARDAWVLRVIGETHGPVLEQNRPSRQKIPRSREPRHGLRRPLEELRESGHQWRLSYAGSSLGAVVAISALLALAAVGLGLSIARSGGRQPGPPRLGAHASSGLLRVSFPLSWRRIAPPSEAAVPLTDELALAPPTPAGAVLVVGRATASNPQLLPQSLLSAVAQLPPPTTITLGRTRLFRYSRVAIPRSGLSGSLYARSTSTGVVLAECLGRVISPSFLSACERSVATLSPSAGTTLPPGPIPAYASALNRTISQLNAARSRYGSQLRLAALARAQARAAYALAAAHTQAALALAHTTAGPAGPANLALVAALSQSAAAYQTLGRAASGHSLSGYALAREKVRRAAVIVTTAYTRLKPFGYAVG